MNEPWYRGDGRQRGDGPAELPVSLLKHHDDPRGYLADPGLVDAVNVALHLGQPLLLTGQPGTGKTQLAYSLAWELNFGEVHKFETKSTSVARDLFYTYDALGRFHAVHSGEGPTRTLDYLRWHALGLAILEANAPDVKAGVDEGDLGHRDAGHPQHAGVDGGGGRDGGEGGESHGEQDSVAHGGGHTFAELLAPRRHPGRRRSVVLIDEIDKAPRDFPNDLLNEVEGMYFKVPELGQLRLAAEREMRPVLVLTSNSEKNLAEAFLRRCVFYHIPFPDPQRLRDIVHRRIDKELLGGGPAPARSDAAVPDDIPSLLDDALELFARLRDPAAGLLKRPSTGELLAWLRVLTAGPYAAGDDGLRQARLAEPTVCALVKTVDDRDRAREVWKRWLEPTPA